MAIFWAKNSALTLLPCALLTDEPLTLRNLPRLADIDGFQHLLNQFGNTRVLSSPKLMALNNQTALLKVVDNLVYFTIEAQTTTTQGAQSQTFNTTPQTVPIGMVMSLSHLVPIAISLYYGDGALRAFLISMIFNFAVAYVSFVATRDIKHELKPRDGMLLVVLA